MRSSNAVPIQKVEVSCFRVPTDFPESDGTFDWSHTTIVLVHATAAGKHGLGYTYANMATAKLVQESLAAVVTGMDSLSVQAAYMAMWRTIRNLGRPGICSMAISAVDCALWDLKAKLLELPLVALLGQVRPGAQIYGSGGFTSYSDEQLAAQLSGWVHQGIRQVKMKIGRDASRDIERVRVAREAIGPEPELFVDANGAYGSKLAIQQAQAFTEVGVRWFEEPVSSDDLDGLRFVREHAPAMMEIAAGEYGYDIFYFRRMLDAKAVDVLQADVTRCGGITSLMEIAALCQAHNILLSGHTAPSQHVHPACAIVPFKNLEYFHDHVRIERMFFDGLPQLSNGELRPDLSRPGTGLEFKATDARKFAA
jgi:L-alanine-DL-glutamate epimerase-like enolase superfamily enzyme